MRTKSRIFTIMLFIRFGFLLSKLVKSKPEAIKKRVKETDKSLQCYEPLLELPLLTCFIRKMLYNMPKPILEGFKT